MPVEVKELIIRAVVAKKPKKAHTRKNQANSAYSGNELIIKACVEQVLKILKKSKER